MVTINLADQAAALDDTGLSVTVGVALPSAAEDGGAADSFTVYKFLQPPIPSQGPPVNGNPYFAGGSGVGWNGFNGTVSVSGSPPAGCPQQYAAQFTNNNTTLGALEESGTPFTLIQGTSPVMTCWVYSGTGQATIGFDWQDASHTYISTSTQVFTVPPNTWIQLAYAANPPWSSNPVYAYPRVGPQQLLGVIWATAVVVTFEAPLASTAAPVVFVKSAMPVMHIQNLVTGAWVHRNVQGISQPSVTWNLNAADSFSCTFAPPRPDMLDATGNPILQEWVHACYLEEDNEIKWGGILTSSTINGPALQTTWTGFGGYPAGIPYEGADYVKSSVESLDVVRYLWNWVQTQHSNLGITVTTNKETGVLLGAQLPSVPLVDKLNKASHQGDTVLFIAHPDPWAAGDVLRVGNEGTTYTIKSISGHAFTLTAKLKGASGRYVVNATVTQVLKSTPFALYWYNSTDIGQEIDQIRQEAVFDWRERHQWSDTSKASVRHFWNVGVPRIGTRRTDLRFAEGENIVQAVTVTRDGSVYADQVIGLGYGSGSSTIRGTVSKATGRLSRPLIYTNATATTTARITAMAQKELAARINIDTPTQVVVINHPNAPLGSFVCGDDIPVTLCTGWRNTTIWCRITAMTQDPTTQLMTLTTARSDSFTYLAESGQGGTL